MKRTKAAHSLLLTLLMLGSSTFAEPGGAKVPPGLKIEVAPGNGGNPVVIPARTIEAMLDKHWTTASFVVLQRSALNAEDAYMQMAILTFPDWISPNGCTNFNLADIEQEAGPPMLERWTFKRCGETKQLELELSPRS